VWLLFVFSICEMYFEYGIVWVWEVIIIETEAKVQVIGLIE
jgi:hypothetical protein